MIVLVLDLLKRSLGFLSIRLLAGLIVLCLSPVTSAPAEQLSVSSVTRITHPAYRMSNLWYSERNPWNRDYTRLLLYENTGFTDPTTRRTGRGHIWGVVSELMVWSTVEEYEAATHQLPNVNCWQPQSLYWSPLVGEENILYGVYTCDQTVSKLNVDTGIRAAVVTYNPGDGTNVSNPRAFGFSSDDHLIVNFEGGSWVSGGYEVAVPGGARTRYTYIPNECSETRKRWPQMFGNGHGYRSPDKEYVASYGAGAGLVGAKANSTEDCSTFYVDRGYPNPDQAPTHVSWTHSNDWFVAENMGSWGGWQTSPYLSQDVIFQITFDRTTHTFTYNTLYTTTTAGYWRSGATDYNWHAIPIPVLRKDGKQMIFWNTDGKYSYDDYQVKGATPWGTEGVFLVDFGLSGTDLTPPSNLRIASVQMASGD